MSKNLIFGDCFDVMPTLQAASVDMVLADLPYGTTNCAWDSQLSLAALWAEYRRICKGPIVLFAQTPFDKLLGASNLAQLRYAPQNFGSIPDDFALAYIEEMAELEGMS